MKNIKKCFFIIFMLILLLSVSLSATTKPQKVDSKSDKLNGKTVIVAGDISYPPYEYVSEDGTFTGFNVDIIKKIAEVKGFNIEIIPMTWEKAVESLESGQVDILQGMTSSGDRSRKVIFSEPILENDYVIFTLKNNNSIESVMDLQGKKVSYQESDIAEEVLKSVNTGTIGKATQREAIKLLLDKEVDAFVGNKLTGMYHLQKINALDKVKVQGSPLLKNNYSMASNKEGIELINVINEGLEELKKTGKYEEIYDKWFGSLFQEKNSTLKILLFSLFIIFILGITITLMIVFYNGKFRKSFDNIKNEKETIIETLGRYEEEVLTSRIVIDKLIENIDNGVLIFDINGVLRRFNNAAKLMIKDDIRVGDTWKSLNLEDIMEINLENFIMIDDIEKKVNMVVDNHICGVNMRILTMQINESKEKSGFTLLIKKLN